MKKRIRIARYLTIAALFVVLLIFAEKNVINLYSQEDEMVFADEAEDEVDEEAEEELSEEEPEFTVCIDPGHGGKDVGANKKDRIEKDDALRLGLALRDYLKEKQIKVVMTRETDDFLKLSERCRIANREKADYLVSIHRNTGKGNGVETWVLSDADEETLQYAEAILDNLESVGVSRNRGVKKGSQENEEEDYVINLNSRMPSCILELGFLNSAEDNRLYDENLETYAAAIGDAIVRTYQEIENARADQSEQEETDGQTASGVTETGHLNNPHIDEASADTTLLEWGQGRNFDDQNRPGGCLMYQDKYGDMSAYFLGPWQEGDPKVIYLTFDIGYTNEYTTGILDTLREKGAKAVFFATMPVIEKEPDIVHRILDEGHVLGNHSVTHPAAGIPSLSVEQQRKEIMDLHNACLDKYGYEMHLFRFPAGKFSAQSLAVVNNCNYRSVFWSWAHRDWNTEQQPDVEESLREAVARLHPGAIYLLHGISSTNAAMLGDLIDQARAQGYETALLQ
ncbi:MAG: N-acetylmuramoyl-L-alanine amidase [Lachnospiraceae bacterium]|nr:N-acetylmuramoyl-L-alanine amidase [Lachnospiraceae bacterium]